jgi:hypothetical protein
MSPKKRKKIFFHKVPNEINGNSYRKYRNSGLSSSAFCMTERSSICDSASSINPSSNWTAEERERGGRRERKRGEEGRGWKEGRGKEAGEGTEQR